MLINMLLLRDILYFDTILLLCFNEVMIIVVIIIIVNRLTFEIVIIL